jgi:uncharacterized repeat protein (TIGR01451 family)
MIISGQHQDQSALLQSRLQTLPRASVWSRLLLSLVLLALGACDRPAVETPTPPPAWTPTPHATAVVTLQALKLVDSDEASVGDVLRYTLVIINDMISVDDPGTTVELQDQLPRELEFVEGSLSPEASYHSATHTVHWSGAVPQGGSVQIAFDARLGDSAGDVRSVLNAMWVTDAFGRQREAAAQTHILHTLPTPSDTPSPATPTPAPLTPTPTAAQATPQPTTVQWPEPSVPYATSMVVTPDDPPIYYLVADFALYHSLDRGSSWASTALLGVPAGARVNSVTIDYNHPQTMYLATSEGLYRREATEEPWQLVNTIRVTALAVDWVNSDLLWAGIGWDTAMRSVIVQSDDRGRTWSKADYGTELGHQYGWVGAILVNPSNPNVIWAHVRAPFRHDWPRGYVYRGGRAGTWERLPLGEFDYVGGPDPFGGLNDDVCFVSGLAYDPNLNALYAGCDISYYNGQDSAYRLLRSLNADAPDSGQVAWEVRAEFGTASLCGVNSVRPLAVDARHPKSLFVFLTLTGESGPPRFALLRSHDDGATWQEMPLQGLPGR